MKLLLPKPPERLVYSIEIKVHRDKPRKQTIITPLWTPIWAPYMTPYLEQFIIFLMVYSDVCFVTFYKHIFLLSHSEFV